MKPMDVDDGVVEVLRVETKAGNENFEGVLKDKVMEDILLPLPIIEDKKRHDYSNMLDCD